MRFTCSFVTSIFLGLMSVVGLLLVVLQSSSSDIQLGPTHPRTCLPLPCPPRRGASSPRKPYSYPWPKGRHHRRGHHRNSHCRDHRYRQHSGHRKREHRTGDRQKPNAERQWWLADDVEVHPIARRDHPLGHKAPRRCMPPRCPRRDRHVGWAVGGYPWRACSPRPEGVHVAWSADRGGTPQDCGRDLPGHHRQSA
ncbi:unnamed protein product [Ectocarpus sp. 6 AP-2014]